MQQTTQTCGAPSRVRKTAFIERVCHAPALWVLARVVGWAETAAGAVALSWSSTLLVGHWAHGQV